MDMIGRLNDKPVVIGGVGSSGNFVNIIAGASNRHTLEIETNMGGMDFGRSDHASFQDNLGTVTVGFGGLVDGYWCYHQVCDTLEEMEEWMDSTGKDYGEENTGVANLANSLDMITWWALMTFFHCDEKPVLNALQ